jgi:cytochrome c556
MKLQTLLIFAFALGVSACAEKEQAAPPEAAETEMAAESVAAETPMDDEMPMDDRDKMGSASFITHMHHHASQLEWLNQALEEGSLSAAQRPAYWLSGHDDVIGVPDEWRVYVDGLHNAAEAVAAAPDIATARAAAQRIEENCAACHTAAGVDISSAQVD